MQLALIPPRGLEGFALASNFHMALAHITHRDYLKTYGIACARGDYIILDNGEAEGAMVSTKNLIIAARRIGAQEIIAPDKIGDSTTTLGRVRAFLKDISRMPDGYKVKARIMAVAHGTRVQVRQLIEAYADFQRIEVIGIPRALVTEQNKAERIDLANWIERHFPERFRIHLLGASEFWPKEIYSAVRYAPHIRSVDTSMPFNYALLGESLNAPHPVAIKRFDRYFENARDFDLKLVGENIQTMQGWINVETPISQV